MDPLDLSRPQGKQTLVRKFPFLALKFLTFSYSRSNYKIKALKHLPYKMRSTILFGVAFLASTIIAGPHMIRDDDDDDDIRIFKNADERW